MKINRRMMKNEMRPIKIMQFGEGNFLRAFVDYFIQVMNDEGLIDSNVVVVQPMPFGKINELREQDGLYTLFLEGVLNKSIIKTNQVIDVISDYINPFEDLEHYLDYAKSEELEMIISNTTEAGITYLEETLSTTVTPESFPGKLLLFLHERYLHFEGSPESGLDIIPCELIDYNGDKLKTVLIQLAQYQNYDDKFMKWLKINNRYYNTLVDRIVPGYPKDNAKELEEMLGYEDEMMVKGEVFHLWVIEGSKKLQKKLPFQRSSLKVFYVNIITPYKERKVKILNGTHTALVPVAYLAGFEAVKEAVEDVLISRFITHFIFDEVIPTIDLEKRDMELFANNVLERYKNPFVHHLLLSIALNSVSKFKSRILPTITYFLNKEEMPYYGLFSLAALMVFYKGVTLNGTVIPLVDEQRFLDFFKKEWKEPQTIVNKFVSLDFWETSLLNQENVIQYLNQVIHQIETNGMCEAIQELLKEHPYESNY